MVILLQCNIVRWYGLSNELSDDKTCPVKQTFLGCNFYHNRDLASHVASYVSWHIWVWFCVFSRWSACTVLVSRGKYDSWHFVELEQCLRSISCSDLLPGVWFLAMSSLMFFKNEYEVLHARWNPIPEAANPGVNFIEPRSRDSL